MKSSGVSNVISAMMTAAGAEAGNGISTDELSQEFGMLLNQKTSQGMADVMDLSSGTKNNADSITLVKPQQTYEKERNESGYREITKAGNTDVSEKSEALKEDYQELKDKIKEELTEELGISEEELLEAMEAMGITFGDLMNGDGVKELMVQLTNTEDMTELLFSDTFQTISRNLEALVQEFTVEAELTPEEWEMVLQKLQETENGVITTEEPEFSQITETGALPETNLSEETSQNAVQFVQTQEDDGAAEVLKTTEIPEEEVVSEKQPDVEEMKTAEEPKLVEERKDADNSSGQDMDMSKDSEDFSYKQAGKEQKSDLLDEHQKPQHVTTYQQTQTTVDALGEIVTQTVEQTSYVDVEDIIHQIVEFTKVTVQQTQSSIEMQLNPAHLGKVYLQVAVKEGMITAQLAAQNEAVKQALETQAAVLKENLNQQGLKVEAVEVTIASHEFEQNLENREADQRERETGKEGRNSQRTLTADRLSEMADTLSEEESLAAKIMLENGNSMDMTA